MRLHSLCGLALMVAGIANASTVRAMVLWKGDFETGDLSQWDGTLLIKTGDRDNLVFVDTCAEGLKCAKITLRDDIIFEPYNQSRVEVKHIGLHTLNGEDSYYAWSFMVPKDAEIRSNIGYWESTMTSLNTMTFFIEPADGGGTNVKFGTGDLGKTVRWTAKLELNKWHRMAIHNHWSQSDTDGKVDVWYDGMQVVTGATATKRDQNKLFFQMGLHRSDPAPPVQEIYIDAAMEADSQDDILKELPMPMGGGGGMGGAAGMGGIGGAAGGVGGAAGGMAMGGTAGDGTAGAVSGGAPFAGSPAVAGMAGQGGAPSVTNTGSTVNQDSGCSIGRRDAHASSVFAALALAFTAGAGAARRRRRAQR